MNNIISKMVIGNKEYSFKMTNSTIIKLDEMYGNYGSIIYGIMEGIQFYSNAIKLMVGSCTEDITEDEIINNATSKQMSDIPGFAVKLYLDYMGYSDSKNKNRNKNRNKNKKK